MYIFSRQIAVPSAGLAPPPAAAHAWCPARLSSPCSGESSLSSERGWSHAALRTQWSFVLRSSGGRSGREQRLTRELPARTAEIGARLKSDGSGFCAAESFCGGRRWKGDGCWAAGVFVQTLGWNARNAVRRNGQSNFWVGSNCNTVLRS